MVGGDTMTARLLYENEFDFVPHFKLWIRTNAAPCWDGGDTGMRRRVKLVPFDRVPVSKDPQLPGKLREESSGILNWALIGLREYQKSGLVEPEIVTKSTVAYADALDPIQQFLEAECLMNPRFQQSSGEVFGTYKAWAEKEKVFAVGSQKFSSELRARGFEYKTVKGTGTWQGLRTKMYVGPVG